MSATLELDVPSPATLLTEGQAPPTPPPSPGMAAGVPPAPGTAESGGWTEEGTKRVIAYAWQQVVAPALHFGVGADGPELQLQQLELEVLSVLTQAMLNRHLPLVGDSVDPEKADRFLILVLAGMIVVRAVRAGMRRGRFGPLTAEERAAKRGEPVAPRAPRPQPQPQPATNGHAPAAQAQATTPVRRQPLGGVIGDGRTFSHSN